MEIFNTSQTAARFWHEKIGRFLTDKDWDRSLVITYPKKSGPPGVIKAVPPTKKKRKAPYDPFKTLYVRIGVSGANCIMIDANSAVFIDELDMRKIPGVAHPDCTFLFGSNVKGEVSITKTQINWALSPDRVYPLLLLRPSRSGVMPCLRLTQGPHAHVICSPGGNVIYDSVRVRTARDYILLNELSASWKRAAQLREIIGRGEHMLEGISDNYRQKMLDEHAVLLEKFPLDVWLPLANTGDHEALNNVLAVKNELPIATLRSAREIFLESQNQEIIHAD